ncbi:hypothetical protein HPB50_010794 [Hyalomma asiaticum]|uniref:Uncharacterized protein n=1 Tax=Hyalomma asiaticum TaxID=266040 RepID=A0ACB7TII4_HYAAI|nr:hypothetical protein HPB50_010794 [Hyalomma asiaticum]
MAELSDWKISYWVTETALEWTMQGPSDGSSNEGQCMETVILRTSVIKRKVTAVVTKFSTLESVGVNDVKEVADKTSAEFASQACEPLPPTVTWRTTLVPFGTTASPVLHSAMLQHNLKKYEEQYPQATNRMNTRFYLDYF